MKPSILYFAITILALLVNASSFAASATDPRSPEELRIILDAAPPDPKENSKAALTKIYLERGRAANALGDFDREFSEITAGIGAVGAKDANSYELHHRLAGLNIDRGDFVAGRAAREARFRSPEARQEDFFR